MVSDKKGRIKDVTVLVEPPFHLEAPLSMEAMLLSHLKV